jgi:AAA domain
MKKIDGFPSGVLTLSQLLARFGDFPEPIIENVMHKNALWVVCAAKETGKTTLLCELAVRIVGGVTKDGLRVPYPGCVVFILPEAHEIAGKAAKAAGKANGVPATTIEERMYFVDATQSAWANPQHQDYEANIEAIISDQRERTGLDTLLIVQDTAQDFLTDAQTVSDDTAARAFYRAGRRLKTRHKLCYAAILHPGRNENTFSGSQAWFNLTDFFAFLSKEAGGGRFIGRSGQQRMANRHKLKGWARDGKIGLAYRGINKRNGHLELSGFEWREKHTKVKKEPKQTAQSALKTPRKNSDAFLVHEFAIADGLKRVEKDDLLKIVGAPNGMSEREANQKRERIEKGLTKAGWLDKGEYFERPD